MDNNIFQEIDQLHSELSKMDNASKITYRYNSQQLTR